VVDAAEEKPMGKRGESLSALTDAGRKKAVFESIKDAFDSLAACIADLFASVNENGSHTPLVVTSMPPSLTCLAAIVITPLNRQP
jgi:hypothetical protein